MNRIARPRISPFAAPTRAFSNGGFLAFCVATFLASVCTTAPQARSAPATKTLTNATSSTRSLDAPVESGGKLEKLTVPNAGSAVRKFTAVALFDASLFDASLAAVSDDLVSNASPQELNAARLQLASLVRLLDARDANTLQIFGLQNPTPTISVVAPSTPKNKPNRALSTVAKTSALKITLNRLAISPRGALMRLALEAPIFRDTPSETRAIRSTNIDASTPQPFVNQTLFTGSLTFDFWRATQSDGSVSLQAWPVARDAADLMSDDAERHWQNSDATEIAKSSNKTADAKKIVAKTASDRTASGRTRAEILGEPLSISAPTATFEGDLLDLVAEYRGGRWLPLRSSAPWRGALLDTQALDKAAAKMQALAAAANADSKSMPGDATSISSTRTVVAAQTSPPSAPNSTAISAKPGVLTARSQTSAQFGNDITGATARSVRPWLVAQMNRYRKRAAGTAHFIFQRSANGWIGVDSVFEAARESTDMTYVTDDAAVRKFRLKLDGDGFLSAVVHRDFALLLSRVRLLDEAADELAKARQMQPDLVTDAQSQTFERNRVLDPQIEAQTQREALKRIGFAAEHPILHIPFLLSQFRRQASPLTALRLGLEYSRLGYEREAAASLDYGEANAAQFSSLPQTSDIDRAWFDVLLGQLRARLSLSISKPPNIVRSDLFTVRCSLNDPNAPQLLAGLETAQLKIYSSFGVPMGNTEVILWSSQNQFQAYTTRQAGRNTSEFVTALTITQLVNADVGPVVLGEEINFFADARADSISTIAHEYGHIAVRALAKGRAVPDWLNEGIATYTEGGYENYLRRVRNARSTNRLLSMRELQAWNVDGERAFLAYSQANSLVDFIVARWGKTAILDILAQMRKDVSLEIALRQTLGVSSDNFYSLWLQNGIK